MMSLPRHRERYLIEAERPEDVPPSLTLLCRSFVCLLALDASEVPDATIEGLARRLFAAGCVYICCWGAACSRVHDFFDEVDVERAPDGPFAMSTWHEGESLAEALRFACFDACPDDAFAEDCRAVVAISVGSPAWAAEIRRAMSDPERFSPLSQDDRDAELPGVTSR